jgi:uncharacterized membrane protein YhaH (DUF805 family)
MDSPTIPLTFRPWSWRWFLLSFKGRISRREYWQFWLAYLPALLGFRVIIEYARLSDSIVVQAFPSVVTIWPCLALFVKRLHDTSWSAWWATAAFGGTAMIVILVEAVSGRLILISGHTYLGAVLGWITSLAYVGAVLVWMIVFFRLLTRGTVGPNRFGADPLAQS